MWGGVWWCSLQWRLGYKQWPMMPKGCQPLILKFYNKLYWEKIRAPSKNMEVGGEEVFFVCFGGGLCWFVLFFFKATATGNVLCLSSMLVNYYAD